MDRTLAGNPAAPRSHSYRRLAKRLGPFFYDWNPEPMEWNRTDGICINACTQLRIPYLNRRFSGEPHRPAFTGAAPISLASHPRLDVHRLQPAVRATALSPHPPGGRSANDVLRFSSNGTIPFPAAAQRPHAYWPRGLHSPARRIFHSRIWLRSWRKPFRPYPSLLLASIIT